MQEETRANRYLVPRGDEPYESLLEIKRSEFIGHIKRVSTVEEARAYIESVRKTYHDARHVCSAFVIGADRDVQRSSDDGEPAGTAGVPMMQALLARQTREDGTTDLSDVVAVVVRYFGGIKLGAGGLIRAYSNVTTEAVHRAGVVQRIKQLQIAITVSYRQHDALLYYLKEHQLAVSNEDYGVNVTTNVFINEATADDTIAQLQNRFNHQLEIQKMGSHFHEIPYNPAE